MNVVSGPPVTRPRGECQAPPPRGNLPPVTSPPGGHTHDTAFPRGTHPSSGDPTAGRQLSRPRRCRAPARGRGGGGRLSAWAGLGRGGGGTSFKAGSTSWSYLPLFVRLRSFPSFSLSVCACGFFLLFIYFFLFSPAPRKTNLLSAAQVNPTDG